MNGLDCEIRQIPGGQVLAVRGDVDLATAGQLSVEAGLCLTAGRLLVLDCSGVTFMDSTGLRTIMDLHQHAEAGAGGFAVAALSDPVRRLFELAGVETVLTILDRAPGDEPDDVARDAVLGGS